VGGNGIPAFAKANVTEPERPASGLSGQEGEALLARAQRRGSRDRNSRHPITTGDEAREGLHHGSAELRGAAQRHNPLKYAMWMEGGGQGLLGQHQANSSTSLRDSGLNFVRSLDVERDFSSVPVIGARENSSPLLALLKGNGLVEGVVGETSLFFIETSGWTSTDFRTACKRNVSVTIQQPQNPNFLKYSIECQAFQNAVNSSNSSQSGDPEASNETICGNPDAQGKCEIYQVQYKPALWGTYLISIFVDGQTTQFSPYQAFIFPPSWYPWYNNSLLLSPKDDWQYGDKLQFSIVTKNYLGARTNSCDATVSAVLRGGRDVKANVTCARSSSGSNYFISITSAVEDGVWNLYGLMDGFNVHKSPLTVNIRPGVSAKHSYLTGNGIDEVMAGKSADVVLHLMMHNNTPATDCREPALLVLVENWHSADDESEEEGGGSPGNVAGNASSGHNRRMGRSDEGDSNGQAEVRRSILGELVSCEAGVYHFTYTVTAAGNYSLSVLVGKYKDLVYDRALLIEVLPGELSSQHCGVVAGKLGSGTMLYGSSVTFGLYLRDSYGNYISCAHYRRGFRFHNISEVTIYHEPGDDASSASWQVPGIIGLCRDNVYHDGTFQVVDGVVMVTFEIPRPSGESTTKEVALDIEVRVNGRRLKEGPYPTVIRPARLDPANCVISGLGTRGAQPGEEQQLHLQLVNELNENMTTCGSLEEIVGASSEHKCSTLSTADACKARADCEWVVVEPNSGACSSTKQKELVEVYLEVIPESGSALSTQERLSGKVRSCNHGMYTLSYSMTEVGRYSLYVKVGEHDAGGAPFRVTIAPGCRSGAVLFPCLGRGMCLRSGKCVCGDGYLGVDCSIGCPGLTEDGTYCSGRGNCSAHLDQVLGTEIGVCKCVYGYFGRLCDRECPGGASSVCSDNGVCLDNGDCECWSGYGGDKCQFKNKEVATFGSMSALIILVSMLVVTVVLVVTIVLKNAVARRREYRSMVNEDEEGRAGSAAMDLPSHWFLDRCADKILDVIAGAQGQREKREEFIRGGSNQL